MAVKLFVEEYLRISDKPNNEYRDGVLYPKSWPTMDHSIVQLALVLMLRKLGLEAILEVTVGLSATKYLVPDVIASPVIRGPYPTEPVLLCCEVLSQDEGVGAMLANCEEYHDWGVPYCWVVDPARRSAWEYYSSDEPRKVTGASLRAGEYSVNMEELFSAISSC